MIRHNRAILIFILTMTGAFVRPPTCIAADGPSSTVVLLNGEKVFPCFGTATGFWFFAKDKMPQLSMMGHPAENALAVLRPGDKVSLLLSVPDCKTDGIRMKMHLTGINPHGGTLNARMVKTSDGHGEMELGKARVEGAEACDISCAASKLDQLKIILEASGKEVAVQLALSVQSDPQPPQAVSLDPQRRPKNNLPVASSPELHPVMERALIEWDWRMCDGIDTPRAPVSYKEAIEKNIRSGDLLAEDLRQSGTGPQEAIAAWQAVRKKCEALTKKEGEADTPAAWETLWRETHQAKRRMALANPLFAGIGPLLFCKRVPSIMSHQLTQYYGYTARPGGGLFVLDKPGASMQVRCLTGSLPNGSYLKPDVSYDGKKIYFSYCSAEDAPARWRDPKRMNRHYHVYSMNSDGSDVKKLTDGNFDHIQPILLPGGSLICSSSRRGGFHRCGAGPCYLYTLTALNTDGSDIRPISFHETNEWDPAVLQDGRVIYTRWDYVDRDASYYQHLWTVRPDGSNVRTYYGNNTWNPLGIWETRSIPGSSKIMGTAGPHHAMSAGSIVLVDVNMGVDGPKPLQRLTPDALFPESEAPLARSQRVLAAFDDPPRGSWQRHRSKHRRTRAPIAQQRWPGHCYRSPWPLSETVFLAAYSYDRLLGEVNANIPNMFGLYLVDRYGNRELLYRDPNISSQWPIPLSPRKAPPQLPAIPRKSEDQPGVFALQNVYESWPAKLGDKVTHLRIVQVLKKTTPNANQPPVGAAHIAPGKQVLGTVPVESDGSALFEVPSKTAVLFQALDARGRAIQTMRSLTYLQPGENLSCIGCHENRHAAPPHSMNTMAFKRPPSKIKPGPEGSKPFSYPILVQGVLDKHCIRCHSASNPKGPAGKIDLTGRPAGRYSSSYNHLVQRVSYSDMNHRNGNHEPMTLPNTFGSRVSALVKMLDEGHHDVELSPEEWERLCTWIDANALFYGTYDTKEQAKQLKGLVIQGPEE